MKIGYEKTDSCLHGDIEWGYDMFPENILIAYNFGREYITCLEDISRVLRLGSFQ